MNRPILCWPAYALLLLVLLGSCAEPAGKAADSSASRVAERNYETYCNPIDIDYSYMSHYRARRDVSYRSGADPAGNNP